MRTTRRQRATNNLTKTRAASGIGNGGRGERAGWQQDCGAAEMAAAVTAASEERARIEDKLRANARFLHIKERQFEPIEKRTMRQTLRLKFVYSTLCGLKRFLFTYQKA